MWLIELHHKFVKMSGVLIARNRAYSQPSGNKLYFLPMNSIINELYY